MNKRNLKTFLLFILLDTFPNVISGSWVCNPTPPVCADDCDGNGYYISQDGTACIQCPQCPAGQELNKDCGNGLNGDAVCIPCGEGFFSLSTSQRCTRCATCTNTMEQEPCQLTQNRVCGDCLPGFVRTSDRFSTDFNACPDRCSDLPRDTLQCRDWWSNQEGEPIEVDQHQEMAHVERPIEEVPLDGIDPCEPKTPLCIDPCHDGNFFLDYDGLCKACLSCQPGEELNKVCGRGKNGDAYCRRCPEGTFSEDGLKRCSPCRICVNTLASECTASRNTECGECLPGYYQDADGYFPDQGACPNKCPECPNIIPQCQEWCESRTNPDQVTVVPAENVEQDDVTPAVVVADIFHSGADNGINDEANPPSASHGSYMLTYTVLASLLAVVVIVLVTVLFLFRCVWKRTDGSDPTTPETPLLTGIADDLLVKLAEDIETNEQMEALGRVLGFKMAAINKYTETNHIGYRITCRGTRCMLFDWRQTVEPCNQHLRLKQALYDAGLVVLADTYLKRTPSIPAVYERTTYPISPEGDSEFWNRLRTAFPSLTTSRPVSGGLTDVENGSSAVSTPKLNPNRRLANRDLLRHTLERQVGVNHDDSPRSTPPHTLKHPDSVKEERMVNSAGSLNHAGPFHGKETYRTQSDRDPRSIEWLGDSEDISRPRASSPGKVVTERESGTVHPHVEDEGEAPKTMVHRRHSIISNNSQDEHLWPLLNDTQLLGEPRNRRYSLPNLLLASGKNREKKLRNGRNGNTAPVQEAEAALFPTDSSSDDGPTTNDPEDTNITKPAYPKQPSRSLEPTSSSHTTPTAAAETKLTGYKGTLVVLPEETQFEKKPAAISDDARSTGNKSPGDTNVTIHITMTTKDIETVHIGDVHNKRNCHDGAHQGIKASEPHNEDDNCEAQKLLNVNMAVSKTETLHVGDGGHVGGSDDDDYNDYDDGEGDKLLDPKSSLVFETQNNSNYVW